MAKNDKLGKLLLGSALAGAAIGTLTYFLKKKGQDSSWDDEDLEDFDDNLTDHKTEDDEDDDDTPVSRTEERKARPAPWQKRRGSRSMACPVITSEKKKRPIR